MEDTRFPRNGREGLLYGGTIAAITAYLVALLNMSRSLGGFRTEYLVGILPTFVVVWIIVMLLMSLIVGRVSEHVQSKYLAPDDSANCRIVFSIVVCVLCMSTMMTAIGPVVWSVMSVDPSMDGMLAWPENWPSNFCAAFLIELALAQPAARALMVRLHSGTSPT